jgi:hypothetical protein
MRAPFQIPVEFRSELDVIEPLETRSDQEIAEDLNKHIPVTSEKNVWAFWDAGYDKTPAWCQRNIINWVRIQGPEWTVRVLDSVPGSPNYALNFIPASLLPAAFVDGRMDGPYVGPHSADFLRGALLFLHGGVFMDVGNILFRDLDRICWNQLEDPASPYQVSIPWMYSLCTANHFVASRKGDPFIKRW